ncbi:MAG: hypothetical protein QOI57_2781 [Rubrobacteraceae bacterium]|nr:hypothetical protein [Rubrobacteraceae bacterium]
MEEKAWVGVDAGKGFHWAHLLDTSGEALLSRKVENDEADLCGLIDEALLLAKDVVSGPSISPGEQQHCSWPCCGSAAKK